MVEKPTDTHTHNDENGEAILQFYMYLQVWYAEMEQHTKYIILFSTCTQYIPWCTTWKQNNWMASTWDNLVHYVN